MRTLRFNIDKQIISKDPKCDFTNIVPGTAGYLKAVFSFSSEWNNTVKVAAFYRSGRECPPQLLDENDSCVIPAEALTNRRFTIKILGKNENKDLKLTTNKIVVEQNGG